MTKITEWQKIEDIARTNLGGLIFDCEQSFDNRTDEIAKGIYNSENARIIMLAGPSSSGKTTFSKILSARLQHYGIKTHYIGLDDFFIDRNKVPFLPSGVRDYDSLRAMDVPLVKDVISGVLNEEWVEVPEYDFIEGKRKSEKTFVCLHPEDLVIFEGIHALNPIFCRSEEDSRIIKIAIKPQRSFIMPSGAVLSSNELRLLRRTIRDYYTRGHSFEATAKQWSEVIAAEDIYINPYLEYADYNMDSSHPYELFIYKEYLGAALENCNVPAFDNIKKVLSEISDIKIADIPTTSILNEFAIAKI